MTMTDFLSMATMLTSIVSTFGIGAIAYGYRASLWSDDLTTRWFAWSVLLINFTLFSRGLWWDVIIPTARDRDPSPYNLVINTVAIIGVYCGLKARLLLIPREERGQWRWWNSWQHPNVWQMRVSRSSFNVEKRGE